MDTHPCLERNLASLPFTALPSQFKIKGDSFNRLGTWLSGTAYAQRVQAVGLHPQPQGQPPNSGARDIAQLMSASNSQNPGLGPQQGRELGAVSARP